MSSKQTLMSNSAGLVKRIGSQKTVQDYRNKESIFAQGDVADAVFYIEHGNVKLTVVSQSGKKAAIAILRRGDFFGEGCLAKDTVRMSSAAALHPSTISRVKRGTFARLVRQDAAFSNLFVAYLVSRVRRIEEDYVDQVLNPSEKRLARMLWSLTMDRAGATRDHSLKVSQSTLAEMIGTTRSRVSFFMNRFRKLGLIEYNGSVQALPALQEYLLAGHGVRLNRRMVAASNR
jgi:CRP/FNR family transcriptional regulator, cyclic AMP receptor protein